MAHANHSHLTLAGTTFVAFVLIGILWRRHKNSKSCEEQELKVPSKWKRVGEVSNIMFYPLKSGRGIQLEEAECASLGLVDIRNPHLQLCDREFIVYDPATRKAVTALVKSRMVLVAITPEGNAAVRFSFPGVDDFLLQLPVETGKVDQIEFVISHLQESFVRQFCCRGSGGVQSVLSRVLCMPVLTVSDNQLHPELHHRWWGEQVSAVDCGDAVAHWLSRCVLDKPTGVRLGHFSQPIVPTRTVQSGWVEFAKVYQRLRSEYLGAYSYLASYLIITEESVADMKSRLSKHDAESMREPVRQFRANIVVRGAAAYSEDSWDWLRLGDSVIMRGFKPCTRCAVIAIDPDTGKLNPSLEPLHTLKEYRQLEKADERKLAGSEPVFGLYTGLHTRGRLRLGDPVYVGLH